jgi:3-hydroxyisobutyrate dehydrogenase-like beta-hydroxyacid dehydrogenase
MGKVGFVGVGKMGSRMAHRLIDAGHDLTVWNRKDAFYEENMGALVARGAEAARTPGEASDGKDICFVNVADGQSLNEVCLGLDGILNAPRPARLLVDMATVGPWESEEIAAAANAKGVGFLRSPVSGSTSLAEAGELTIICSGEKEDYDRAEPYLASIGKLRYYVGPGENSRYLKLIFNLNIFAQMQILAESAVLGEKGGLDWHEMLETITSSVAASPFVKYKIPLMQDRRYAPAFTISLACKDLRLALEAARRAGVEMPMAQLVLDLQERARAEGFAELDVAAVTSWYERAAGIDHDSEPNSPRRHDRHGARQ